MGQKIKIAGWVSVGVIAGALTTVSLQTVARGAMTPLPLEEIQQLSAVFGLIKTDYVAVSYTHLTLPTKRIV